MRTTPLGLVTAGLIALAVACEGSPSPDPGATDSGDAGPRAAAGDIATYQALTARLQLAVMAYRTSMMAPEMTLAACTLAHDRYDASVRPWVTQMVGMSAEMDAFIGAHRGAGFEDMACVAQAMLGELDAHRQVACTFTALGDDRDEAVRHAGAMIADAGHAYDRCSQMTLGPGGSGYAWGPMMGECTPGGTSGDPVAFGERVYDLGIGADGRSIAHTGGVAMMRMRACASCHGADGHGRRTMMFTAPDITYDNLLDPLGMREPDGDRGPTYTDALIRRAVVEGIGADGDALDTTMPRWQLGDQDWGDLLAYMKTLP